MSNVSFVYSKVFIKKAKQLKKKHPSLVNELHHLELELSKNLKLGIDLGNGVFKIRLAVKSKGKGKSGGYRVITYLQTENQVNLIYIYDKSEEATITKADIQKIIDSL
ncbi:hypothetical protein EZJ43_08465 [Pedobacter changchengzhani]|uniref:Addiction module toxin RelE n=1 Tax=Pedobacter changchengzhani TaxID=2529274 RepID=A0A4R5MLF9_9SPHI|nr:type II toxin-antitoxin system RelE/ParE family toxin [Pedobacter changchengzhani]TDG36540.1 hypothetical protein EZJ43_08465 [Pedobacter changchengzhani]